MGAKETGLEAVAWMCQSAYDAHGIVFTNESAASSECRDRGLEYIVIPLVPLHAAESAVAREREVCAAMVDGWHISRGGYGNLAAAIRARGIA